jgi:hypothetical protein
MVKITKVFKPRKENIEIYKYTYKKYVKLYDDLCGLFSLEKLEM